MKDYEGLDFFGEEESDDKERKGYNDEELAKILKLEEEAQTNFDAENLEEIINFYCIYIYISKINIYKNL